jgi:hypothetical protein
VCVACNWDNNPSKMAYLAKTYDPLYSDFENVEYRGIATGVVWNAERDYTVQTTYYRRGN